MDLKVYKDTLGAISTICDAKAELPIETEVLLPDYLPQVFKIVKCFVSLVVLQKQVSSARLTVEGYLRLAVWYQAEDDETLCTTEQKIPFSKQFEVQPGEYTNPQITVTGETEYMHCRAVNSRRIDIRGAFALMAHVQAQSLQEVVTAVSGEGMQQKMEDLRALKVLAVQEKPFTVEDSVRFEAVPQMILDCVCVSDVQEVRFTAGKAIVKGNLLATITYRTGAGFALQQTEKELPFNEILDVDHVDESCQGIAFVEALGCTIVNSEENGPGVSVSALIHLQVMRSIETMCVKDAFSTLYETELTACEIMQEKELVPFEKRTEVVSGGPVPEDMASIITSTASCVGTEIVAEGDTMMLRGRVLLHVICATKLDELNCYDKTVEYKVPLPPIADGESYLPILQTQVLSASVRYTGTELTAAVLLHIQGALLKQGNAIVVQDVVCTQLRKAPDVAPALRIYYAQTGEELFDIAKRYATSPQAIADANHLDLETPISKTQLLIPLLQ